MFGTEPLQFTGVGAVSVPFAGGVTIVNVSVSPSGSLPFSPIDVATSSVTVAVTGPVVGARFGTRIEQFAVAIC